MKPNNPQNKQNALIQQAIVLHHSGRLSEAAAQFKKLLNFFPKHPQILTGLGTIALQKGNFEEGIRLLGKSLEVLPNQPLALSNCAMGLSMLKRLDEALASYDKAIALMPNYAEAYTNRGNVLLDLKRLDEAIASYDRAIELNPGLVEASFNRGNALLELRQFDQAIASYGKVISFKPDYVAAYNNRGIAQLKLKRLDDALADCDQAIVLKPDFVEAHNNRGNVLLELQRPEEALASYNRAIALNPDYVAAYTNRGNALLDLKRPEEALASYDGAIALRPDYVEAYTNRGNALRDLKRLEEALASYDQAIYLKPDLVKAYYNRGNTLLDLKRPEKALSNYERASALEPNLDFLSGKFLHTKMQVCDWENFESLLGELIKKIYENRKASEPFSILALIDDPGIQEKCAEIYVQDKFPAKYVLPEIAKYPKHDKVRIGYFSADFQEHATMHLMAEMLEHHSRNQFELTAFSFGPDSVDQWRTRAVASFDKFIDVRHLTDREVAMLARTMEIDIAVDLKGFTQDCRTGIFAERAAPIQVNYLGYPGTMGAEYIDYLIADRILIPEDKKRYYSEKIVYLPDSYQANISKRAISEKSFTRADVGLPESGFVFCCFNNNYKITPDTFDSWMRILKQVDGSVLWLFQSNHAAVRNLQQEAERRGIDKDRLIFASHMPIEDHLARSRLADLFLDTLPCNAHTTASDALRAGLPVVTCIGDAFAARVAASLLNAVHLPELITRNQEEYEALTVCLAKDARKLDQISNKLQSNLAISPLYDSELFTRHIEFAYMEMYKRYQNDLAPEHVYVEG